MLHTLPNGVFFPRVLRLFGWPVIAERGRASSFSSFFLVLIGSTGPMRGRDSRSRVWSRPVVFAPPAGKTYPIHPRHRQNKPTDRRREASSGRAQACAPVTF